MKAQEVLTHFQSLARRTRVVVRVCVVAVSLIASRQAAIAFIEITEQPKNTFVSILSTATFSISARVVGEPGAVPKFQWQRLESGQVEWADIPGANSSSYTTPSLVKCVQNDILFQCKVSHAEESVLSNFAILGVYADCSPPYLVNASSGSGLEKVVLSFSRFMDPNSALDIFNYSITKVTDTNGFSMGSVSHVEFVDPEQ